MLFDVRFDGDEVLVDERGGLLIRVRLGFQPSAGASRRRGAEIEEEGAAFRLRGGERLIDVSAPVHEHRHLRAPVTSRYGVRSSETAA